MNCVFLANGRVGVELLRWVRAQGPYVAGLVIHPPDRARQLDELIDASGLPQEAILDATRLHSDEGLAWLRACEPEWLIVASFGYLLRSPVLAIPKRGALNLHPSLLPLHRGAYPNVWTIVDGTPAGATLHYVDEGLDTGDVVAQVETPVSATDTGGSLYRRLEDLSLALFQSQWPSIISGALARRPQGGVSSQHRRSDVEGIDRIDPEATYRAGHLIDILRARTFPPFRSAYLDLPDRRVYLRLELSEELKDTPS